MLALLFVSCVAPNPVAGELDGFVAAQDPTLPTVYVVSWADEPGATERFVEYGRDPEALDRRTGNFAGPEGRVVGLTGGYVWTLRAVSVDATGSRTVSPPVEVEVPSPPSELPDFVRDADDPSLRDNVNALVFTAVLQDGDAWLVGLDDNAEYAWWYESPGRLDVDAIHGAADGRGLVFTHFGEAGGDSAGIGHIRFDGTDTHFSPVAAGHHDAIETADGTMYYISSELLEDAVLEGGNVSTVSTDTVMKLTPGSSDPSTLFSFPRDYPHELWRPCAHFDQEKAGGGHDFSHTNSVMLGKDPGQLVFMSKNLDSLMAIDAESGALAWQIGGRYSDYADVDGDDPPDDEFAWRVDGANHTWWSHGHMSDYWGDGMLVFDNGYHHSQMVSRVVEYAIDDDARTIRKVSEWPSPAGTFTPVLGDARRLPNGNRLLSYTIEGRVMEVTPAGEVAWEAILEVGAASGRLVYVPDIYTPTLW